MGSSTRPPANRFVAVARHVYNPIGFSKGYNFVLWFIFAGGLLGFICARAPYFDYDGVFCKPDSNGGFFGAAAGECWSYAQESHLKFGIKMHLWTVLPAGFLAFLHFLPILRHKVILFHQINGYITILLSIVGTAGALMIAHVSFGGGADIQAAVGLLAILFVGSLLVALYNIKRLQLEQHRAWMLRAWFYAGAIISCRLVMSSAAMIISKWGAVYKSFSCDKLASFYQDDEQGFMQKYPVCNSTDGWVAVKADIIGGDGENAAAAMHETFGMAVWLALALHAIGVEIYLRLTPAESERLRNISYKRQIEAGFKNPGSAGLTIDRLGDSTAWEPAIGRNQRDSAYALVDHVGRTNLNDSRSEYVLLQPGHTQYDPYMPHA
ncbi:hypothetical protein FVEN_g6833 [Fusarium venenatum]|uniref:Microtubule associated protein n=1 Tax=Fusarium venenatum TaxID=56646 RepID=A0A2L2TE57_9HYPO|nr:uncharacterized protein FVRRES_00223 [Fusarium venenatum]KAG8355358.1 hypothetical protein FVEN_g6833 [Fusarium venenatum]KAH7006516.1 hypothetical protein EDB82DRAFT_421452 [Fusarium venenatum]CEI63711.1 unnamed protein product [Fusarium venenatum]